MSPGLVDTESAQGAIAQSSIDAATKIAVIEDKVFGENGLIKEVKEIKDKIDRFTFVFVTGTIAVVGSMAAAILTKTFS